MPINISLSVNLFIHDGDLFFPDDECTINLPMITKFFAASESATIEFSECCADEVRVAVRLTASLTFDRTAIQVTGTAKMYESFTCPNNDLHDTKNINHVVPLEGSSQLVVHTADNDDNWSRITLNFSGQNRPPSLQNNNINIREGETITLTSANLLALNRQSQLDNSLQFYLRYVQNGYFQRSTEPGVAIHSFTQNDINLGFIQAVHDGGEVKLMYDVVVSDGDLDSLPSSANVTFTNIEDGPTLILSDYQAIFKKGNDGMLIDNQLRLIDPDTINANVTQASVRINNCQSAEDILVFNDQLNISGNYDQQLCHLALNGTAPIEDYQTALTTIKYNNSAERINPVTRAIAMQVKGADGTFGPTAIKKVGIHKENLMGAAFIGMVSGGSVLLLVIIGLYFWHRRQQRTDQANSNFNAIVADNLEKRPRIGETRLEIFPLPPAVKPVEGRAEIEYSMPKANNHGNGM